MDVQRAFDATLLLTMPHRRRLAPSYLRVLTTPRVLAFAITLVAGGLRLYHIDRLSLWVDEGLTVTFARLPWLTMLGFGRPYGVHPPLYYAVVKIVSALVPELTAGRLVSAVAGTLTIPVLYAFVARLGFRWGSVLAALVLALSPLHIWYSQEARQYTLTMLLVTVSYLALVAVLQSGRHRWVVIYGVSLALALYVEYSAFFALAPQAAVILWAARRERRRAAALSIAACAAALAFVPWLPHLLAVARPTSEQSQFALTAAKIVGTLLSVSGLGNNAAVYSGSFVPPWTLWPTGDSTFLACVALCVTLGVIVLARHSRQLLLIALCLLCGTLLVAITVSLIYPSFTERTVLYAVLGWAIVVAVAPFSRHLGRWAPHFGSMAMASVVSLSLITLTAQDTDAYKQRWDALAAATATASRLGWPIITYPTVADTLLDLYQPALRDAWDLPVDDDGDLPSLIRAGQPRPAAVWLSYEPSPGLTHIQQKLAARGYVLVQRTYYPYPLYLDLLVRPDIHIGPDAPINASFAVHGAWSSRWFLPAQGATVQRDSSGNRLTLSSAVGGDTGARRCSIHAYLSSSVSVDVRDGFRLSHLRDRIVCVSCCLAGCGGGHCTR